MSLWSRLDAFLAANTRACLITLARLEGSSPREAGTRMLVTEGGGFSGTIGGGALEWRALALAQHLLERHPEGIGLTRAFSLGPDLGQCCGGRVELLFEAFAPQDRRWISPLAAREAAGAFWTSGARDARGVFLRALSEAGTLPITSPDPAMVHERHGEIHTPVLLFGAGHVGRALVLALAPLPFDLRWIDARADAFPGHHPANVTPVATGDPVREIAIAKPGSLLLVMTHSHALDLDLVAAGLSNPAVAFTGVIGSATKRARFLSRLKTMGFGEETAARLVCPIGLPDLSGKEPAVIAAGVAVQALLTREHLLRRALPASAAPRKKSAHGRSGNPADLV